MLFRHILGSLVCRRVFSPCSLSQEVLPPVSSLMLWRPFTAASAEVSAGEGPPPLSCLQEQGFGRDLSIPLLSMHAESVGTYVLGGDVFDVPIRTDILHRVVRWQLAKRQQGTHKTKTRSEVSGGGRKPHKQKGSGRARQGTIRAPHMRGGGVAHGPVLRSHEHDLPKRVRRLGLRAALSAKAWEGRLIIVDSLKQPDEEEPKTKQMLDVIDRLLAGSERRSVLLVDSGKISDDGGYVFALLQVLHCRF